MLGLKIPSDGGSNPPGAISLFLEVATVQVKEDIGRIFAEQFWKYVKERHRKEHPACLKKSKLPDMLSELLSDKKIYRALPFLEVRQKWTMRW